MAITLTLFDVGKIHLCTKTINYGDPLYGLANLVVLQNGCTEKIFDWAI